MIDFINVPLDFWVYGFSAVDGGWDWGEGSSLSGNENEALAVSWNGSIVAAAGYLSSGASTHIGYARYIEVTSRGTSGYHLDSVSELENSRFTSVVVSGKKIYAAGYGMDGSEQKAFVRAYDITNYREYPDTHLWDDTFDLTSSGGMVTTGITLAKKQVCVSGYGLEGPGTTDWFVKAYDLNGNIKWLDDFNLNGGYDSKAFGIAASSSAIVAVGQAENGPDGPMEVTVRAYKP